ncbi:MAG: LpqB family beta-propeller domain-containing protein [Streptosporangiaceae bacterium]
MVRTASRRALLPVPLALLVAALAVAGCATAPSGGPPRQAPGGSNQVQAYVQQLPAPGPTSRWTETEVVLGFLHASASYAFDPAAAKQYLLPQVRKQWHPGQEPVAVVGAPTPPELKIFPEIPGASQSPLVTVKFSGQHLATLSQTGQYQYAPGQSQNASYSFTLARTNGVWLIQSLPKQLLLTESDFQDVYQPRNLFFFEPPGAGQAPSVLVPDPVYAPQENSNSALNTDLATGLVNGLLKGQGGWLSGATVSAFPRGTTLLKKVTITGKTALVDLGGAAAHHAQPITVLSMAAQLQATLSDGEYSLPLASRLKLYIDNALQPVPASIGLVPSVASVAGGQSQVLLITGSDSVGQLPAVPKPDSKLQPRLGPAQIGQANVTAVAASPDQQRPVQQFAVAVQESGGCAVEVRSGNNSQYQPYLLPGSVGPCTSLSYDANGNLWAAAGSGAWFMQPNRSPVPVDLSALAGSLPPGSQILALRMAPDAVRAALLVHTSSGKSTGNRLLLAAVRLRGGTAALGQPITVGAGLSNPLAMSWYDAYHLAVLAAGGIYDVPLTGGAGQQPGAAPYLFGPAYQGAVSLTTDGSEFVVGTSSGGVFAASVSAPNWAQVVPQGADPVYPG